MSIALAGLGLLASGSMGLSQDVVDEPMLSLVIDSRDSQSLTIAVGMSSLAKIKVDAFDIDINWADFRDDPLEVMRREESDLGLLNLAEVDPNKLSLFDELTAVTKVWQALDQGGETDGDSDPGYLLVAKRSIDAALIKNFLAAVQSDTVVLRVANLDMERLAPSIAMTNLPLSLHEGAQDYLTPIEVQPAGLSTAEPEITKSAGDPVEQEVVKSRLAQDSAESLAESDVEPTRSNNDQPEQIPLPGQISGIRSYILYFDTDEATTNSGHMSSVARASRYATRFPRAKFVISGHTDTAELTSDYNGLAERRASVVADALRNDPQFREALSVIEFGEAKPVLKKTKDGVSEQMNRRVVITILPDQ